jgi:hypothetical protein
MVSPDRLLIAILLAVSVVPCFWAERAGTGDLLSHVYNVWLVQQIKAGQAPGLSLAFTHTNILFDVLLDHLVAWFGFGMGTKLGLAIAVVIYTGGQIALWRAVAPRGWRAVSPLALMFSYGWLYAIGFINFYVALGLGYFAIALLWKGRATRTRIAVVTALLLLAWTAHFVAVLMIVAVIGYVVIAARLSPRGKRLWFLIGALLLLAGHVFLRLYGNEQYAFRPQWRLGPEQLWLFSDRYAWFPAAVALLWVIALVVLIRRKRSSILSDRVMQVYVLVALAGIFAPFGVRWISYSVTLGLLPGRITAIAAVFGCAIAARAEFGRRVLLAGSLATLAFFALLCGDTRRFNRAEAEIESVVHQLPRGSRIVSDLDWPESRVHMWHLIDRACIGYAYDFGNYEASSGHFRIRVEPGNTLLTWVPPEIDPVATAVLLRDKHIPVYEIYDDEEGHYHARELNLQEMPRVE